MAAHSEKSRGPRLVKPLANGEAPATNPQVFKNGQRVLESGIYRVQHSHHRVPHEVTLIQGHEFPPCSNCHSDVRYELVRAAPYLKHGAKGLMILHCLPELDEGSEDEIAAAS